jgi:hypothetical protein
MTHVAEILPYTNGMICRYAPKLRAMLDIPLLTNLMMFPLVQVLA